MCRPDINVLSILPPDPKPTDYQWQTYNEIGHEELGEEEILYAATCVVYSRGGFVRKVFSFDVEQQEIRQVLLTWFPVVSSSATIKEGGTRFLKLETQNVPPGSPTASQPPSQRPVPISRQEDPRLPSRSRALVVLLKLQAHIFHLSGPSHVINLPFEVDRAFSAPRGLILQRKLPRLTEPATPRAPVVPPNSFLTSFTLSQPHSSPSFNDIPLGSTTAFLAKLSKSSRQPASDDLPRHFTLTDPLIEVGLIVSSPLDSGAYGLASSLSSVRSNVAHFETLEKSESILYISRDNELGDMKVEGSAPIVLVVTANYDRRTFAVWFGTYVEHQSMSKLNARDPQSASGNKSRRRSSFATTPGTVTPTLRPREVRESFGPGSRYKGPASSLQHSMKQFKNMKGKRNEEDILAAQLDPDFNPTQQPTRQSRRVSSLISRTDLSTSFDRSTFQDMATGHGSTAQSIAPSTSRRGHSFGAHAERTSFGGAVRLRARASTPGSFSRLSIGPVTDDLSYDTSICDDNDFDDPNEGTNELRASDFDILRSQSPLEGLLKEFVLSRCKEIAMDAPGEFSSWTSSDIDQLEPKVFLERTDRPSKSSSQWSSKVLVHIVYKAREAQHIEVTIALSSSENSTVASQRVGSGSSPRFRFKATDLRYFKEGVDGSQFRDGHQTAMLSLLRDDGENHALSLRSPWAPLPALKIPIGKLRIHSPYSMADNPLSPPRKEGQRRYLDSVGPLVKFGQQTANGNIDLIDSFGRYHRVQVRLRLRSAFVSRCVEVCDYSLPKHASESLLQIIWHQTLQSPVHQSEWSRFLTALFAIVLVCDDRKGGLLFGPSGSRATSRQDRSKAPTDNWESMMRAEGGTGRDILRNDPSWRWSADAPITAMTPPKTTRRGPHPALDQMIVSCIKAARQFWKSEHGQSIKEALKAHKLAVSTVDVARTLVALHLLREETKLDIVTEHNEASIFDLAPALAQIGQWLGWDQWSGSANGFYDLDSPRVGQCAIEVASFHVAVDPPHSLQHPPSIFQWLQQDAEGGERRPFPTLESAIGVDGSNRLPPSYSKSYTEKFLSRVTPRTIILRAYFERSCQNTSAARVASMVACGITARMMETFPESVRALLQEEVVKCRADPPTTWDSTLLAFVDREDLIYLLDTDLNYESPAQGGGLSVREAPTRDLHTICQGSDAHDHAHSNPESDRHAISRLIFSEDRRLVEAARLLEPLRVPVAECYPEPAWTEAEILDAQKGVVQWVMVRTFSLSPGQAMIWYDSKTPLLTEKFSIHGYNTSCIMRPMNNTVNADRSLFTEEKYGWAWFHAGVSAGLSISKKAEGIDTSWIVFNKPADLNNRHAGLLLGLGLNGHLKSIAKWLSFKYLTPKHTMTSIGLLLGLSASYLGTMDSLITRLLSVHITRMLPLGAAELNLSHHTQTAGLMGIGLLYCRTQHRRMSEVMLSEIERIDQDGAPSSQEDLRDEGYRLAAGFALGFINLGKGQDLRGLHDMRVIERLLAVAVGPRPISLVHVLDRATAAATIAIALIYMKTHHEPVARKIDIPDTIPQFDYVRPDILLLRTVAKQLIMWNDVRANVNWIKANLPKEHANFMLLDFRCLRSQQIPFYNILTGLLWSISLRFAGSGDLNVRDFLVAYLDQFIRLCQLPAPHYDAKLARTTVRTCQDLLAASCAIVMAGTGDLQVFRRLRLLHGRVSPDVPYGSHLASHMALGLLFVGRGTYTVSTTPLSIASLLCAFYPIFPSDVTDNKAHLQAFRHMWVLAATPRCLVIRDIETKRAIRVPIRVTPLSGEELSLSSPCLLPDIDTLASVRTDSTDFWPITLDFANNPRLRTAFRSTQTVYVRKRPVGAAQESAFVGALAALNDIQSARAAKATWDWIFELPSLAALCPGSTTQAASIVLPRETGGVVELATRGDVLDHMLILKRMTNSSVARELWDIRGVLRWAESVLTDPRSGGRLAWLGREVIEEIRARVWLRGMAALGST